MWGKRTREKQTVPQQFLNTCDYFQHKTQGMYVHLIGWCKIEMWEICTEFLERIYCTVELALHEAFQRQHAGKIWVRVSVWQCRKWGLHGLYISRRKSSIADYWNYFMLSENVHSFFFTDTEILSTNNFLFLLITPVNSGSTIVNIKG